jgi:hypothetical protein
MYSTDDICDILFINVSEIEMDNTETATLATQDTIRRQIKQKKPTVKTKKR